MVFRTIEYVKECMLYWSTLSQGTEMLKFKQKNPTQSPWFKKEKEKQFIHHQQHDYSPLTAKVVSSLRFGFVEINTFISETYRKRHFISK